MVVNRKKFVPSSSILPIILISVGSAVALAAIIAVVFIIIRKNKKKAKRGN